MNYRHGDISFHKVEALPKEVKLFKKCSSFVAALGETTGHKHLITATKEALEIYKNEKGEIYLVIGDKTIITHEEHRPVKFKKGVYKMANEREYDWFAKNTVRVLD